MAFNDPDPAPDWQSVATKIHASGKQLVIAVTGGGSGAISTLLQTPGASRTILEAIVPYSHAALTDWIGAKPEQACSAATARAMAMAAFMRVGRLASESDPQTWLGVGVTASLATDRPKRGQRRVHVALQTAERTWSGYASLDELPSNRAGDEHEATELILEAIAGGCGMAPPTRGEGVLTGQEVRATDDESDLLLGVRPRLILRGGPSTNEPPMVLLFPGAFNPRHVGHLQMAEAAERRCGEPVIWELSIANVDKPPLDFISIRERVEALKFDDARRTIALTRAPTFREKSELFPNATFVVGVDTLIRIADPKYYSGDPSQRDAAIAEIAARGCRFLAFGRVMNGEFQVLSDLTLPPALAAICDEVPATEFREDISSTQLRTPPAPE